MRAVGREGASTERPVGPTESEGDRTDADRTAYRAVAVTGAGAAPLDLLGEFVNGVDATRGVHPAGVGVEALIDEELAPGRSAVDIEAFVARHLLFGAEIPARVWIDQQQRVSVGCDLRRD